MGMLQENKTALEQTGPCIIFLYYFLWHRHSDSIKMLFFLHYESSFKRGMEGTIKKEN